MDKGRKGQDHVRELFHAERLVDHAVYRSGLHSFLYGLPDGTGHEDYRRGRRLALDSGCQVQTVHTGHLEISQYKIERM